MTRGRTTNPEHIPTELQAEYYRQRASAGLIFTEGTWISQEAVGFINVPGLFSAAQTDGWRRVTDAVHEEGGVIFAQIAHSGAVSHPDFFGGTPPLAPSAVNPGLKAFTPQGFKDTVTPRAMTLDDIRRTIDDYATAGRNARRAGFDGIELHAATTYLLPEFLSSTLNVRQDSYGGSVENRTRIVLEILDALIDEWGPGRVGIKISPTLVAGNLALTEQTVPTYDHLIEALNDRQMSHLQIVRATTDLSNTPIATLHETIGYYRRLYKGTLIANLGFDRAEAATIIEAGSADLVSFGKPFIGNPDLVHRLANDLTLVEGSPATYYQGGRDGYTDYSPFRDS
jgi:N-ethylmaleimide reductase